MKQLLGGDHGGSFAGINFLWLEGGEKPALESAATFDLFALSPGKLLRCSYTWMHEELPHRGTLIVAWDRRADRVTAAWIDTFHQSGHVMHLEGSVEEDGTVALSGSYPAPPGPNWGWRIRLTAPIEGELVVSMDNVTPDGVAEPAVRIDLRRNP